MRNEYVIVVELPNRKKDISKFGAKKFAYECAQKSKDFYEPRGAIVRFFIDQYYHGGFYKSREVDIEELKPSVEQ